MDMRGKRPRIIVAAAGLGLSVATGVLASAYTTAGMDPFYTRERDRSAGDEIASNVPRAREAADTLSYPPIPTPR